MAWALCQGPGLNFGLWCLESNAWRAFPVHPLAWTSWDSRSKSSGSNDDKRARKGNAMVPKNFVWQCLWESKGLVVFFFFLLSLRWMSLDSGLATEIYIMLRFQLSLFCLFRVRKIYEGMSMNWTVTRGCLQLLATVSNQKKGIYVWLPSPNGS